MGPWFCKSHGPRDFCHKESRAGHPENPQPPLSPQGVRRFRSGGRKEGLASAVETGVVPVTALDAQEQKVLVGVIATIDPKIEAPEEVRDGAIEASEHISMVQPGTADDCGPAPASDDASTSGDTALATIQARAFGTRLAEAPAKGH
jgi:hypothetical protein